MYAIVKFVDEEDAPGIVSTNWINADKDICWYPNVRSEERKNKLLFARAAPKEDWIECPIKVLKQFSNYTEAKGVLSEAEYTSHLESEDCQKKESKARKRKQRTIRLPGEESSSSGDEKAATTSQKPPKKKNLSRHFLKNLSAPPVPPSPKATPTEDNLVDFSRFLSESQPPSSPFVHERSNEIEKDFTVKAQTSKKTQKKNHAFLDSHQPQTDGANDYESAGEESDSLLRGLHPNQHFTKSINWQRNSDIEKQKQKDEEMRKIKSNQIEMWCALGQLTEIAKSNSEKLNTIILKIEQLQHNNNNKAGSGSEELRTTLNLLPVKVEDFNNLVETLKRNNSFRQSLLQILMASSGKDPKAMVSSMLRKLMTDDVGEKFSLTGKVLKGGATKESFEKTILYKLITEACFRVHQDVKENVIREGISDWLMQSKFRKNRREQRKNQSREDTADNYDMNSLLKNQ